VRRLLNTENIVSFFLEYRRKRMGWPRSELGEVSESTPMTSAYNALGWRERSVTLKK